MRRAAGFLAAVALLGTSATNAQEPMGLRRSLPTATSPFARAAYQPVLPDQTATPGQGRLREIGLLIGVFGVALASAAVPEPEVLDCGPCDRHDVPFFDRWAITEVHFELDVVSTATVLGVAGIAWTDVFKRREGSGFAHFGASLESVALTVAVTDMLKNAAGRRRPYAFAEPLAGLGGSDLRTAKSSWPSGHASIAFSLATSYWLSRGHEASPTLKRVTAAATILTALLRVPAGRHFPSDVVSGAAVGTASALFVHTVRF